MRDVQFLIDFILHGQPVTVPPRATGHAVGGLACVAGYDVFDGAGEDVAVVGEAGGEGRAVVERVFLSVCVVIGV